LNDLKDVGVLMNENDYIIDSMVCVDG